MTFLLRKLTHFVLWGVFDNAVTGGGRRPQRVPGAGRDPRSPMLLVDELLFVPETVMFSLFNQFAKITRQRMSSEGR